MAILRNATPALSLPEDFGLGVAVAATIIGIIVLGCAVAASTPTNGPQGEAHRPNGDVYIDIPPAAVPATISTQ